MSPRLEDFKQLEIIGQGTTGLVRKVQRIKDDKILVWKELHYASMSVEEKQSIVLEVNLLRTLQHPNIVGFYNHLVDRHNGTLYIFMEYCPGGDLKKLINKCSKSSSYLTEDYIWKVLKQICEALRFCHEKHVNGTSTVLHRDIKPANVFLDLEGNVKLGDFGLARTLNSDKSFAKTFVGTPYYMSPEVIDGCNYNEKSDMWALGCLIYELCSLKPPFPAANQQELAHKIKDGRYDRIPKRYSDSLNEVIGMLLTQEDFLRPSAIMLLYHSSVLTNTCDSSSLIESLHESPNADSDSSSEGKYDPSLTATVKRKEKTEEERLMEESLMKEIEQMMIESKKRREEFNNLNPWLDLKVFAKNKVVGDASTDTRSFSEKSASTCVTLSKPEVINKERCVCGGMSLNEWRSRIASLRKSEASMKEREQDVQERERGLILREKRVLSMEREAKQHLVRGQIYLKQSRKREPANISHFKNDKSDASTVSADIGYDITPTSAFLDTQSKLNPFLKMRQQCQLPSNSVHPKKAISRSNTLDNPRSRRKCGNLFYLESSAAKHQVVKSRKNASNQLQSVSPNNENQFTKKEPSNNIINVLKENLNRNILSNKPNGRGNLAKDIKSSYVATTGKENDVVKSQSSHRNSNDLTRENLFMQYGDRTFRIYNAV